MVHKLSTRSEVNKADSQSQSEKKFCLSDSHSHVHLETVQYESVAAIKCGRMAVMGTNERDWRFVIKMYETLPNKVIPCFGVHPWFAHLHGGVATAPEQIVEVRFPPSAHPALKSTMPTTDSADKGSCPVATKSTPNPESLDHSLPWDVVLSTSLSSTTPAEIPSGIGVPLSLVKPSLVQPHLSLRDASSSSAEATTPCSLTHRSSTSVSSPSLQQAHADDSTSPSHGAQVMDGLYPPSLRSCVSTSWEAHLEKLLQSYPTAVVGEIGLDFAAVVLPYERTAKMMSPAEEGEGRKEGGSSQSSDADASASSSSSSSFSSSSSSSSSSRPPPPPPSSSIVSSLSILRPRTSAAHQEDLVRRQVALAARHERPVSMHCVRAYGALYDLFRDLAAAGDGFPPRVMLHSYTGSAEMVRSFAKLQGSGRSSKRDSLRTASQEESGVFYFSFNAALSRRSLKKSYEAIRAVPVDRILIESDLGEASKVEAALQDALKLVAEARKWSLSETADIVERNFHRFYETTTQ